MLRLFFDSMVWDQVDANLAFERLLFAAKERGLVQLVRSHIQLDQNDQMSDREKLQRILKLRDKFEEMAVPTSLFILGSSRLGEAKLASPSASDNYLEVVDGVHTKLGSKLDAVIAITAHDSQATLITDDQRLQKRCEQLEFQFWSSERLFQWLKASLN